MRKLTDALIKEMNRRMNIPQLTFNDYMWLARHKWVLKRMNAPVKKHKKRQSSYY